MRIRVVDAKVVSNNIFKGFIKRVTLEYNQDRYCGTYVAVMEYKITAV